VKRLSRVMLLVLVVAACTGCDQVTKTAAKALLPSSGALTMLHNTITLVYTENPGAFLSLGAGFPEGVRFVLFTVAAGLLLPVAFAFLLRSHKGSPLQGISLALIIGGGVGTLIDRLTNHGCVVDFVRLAMGPVRTGVFNVADVAITVGVIIFVMGTLWGSPTPHQPDM